jgi:hypothetical protein
MKHKNGILEHLKKTKVCPPKNSSVDRETLIKVIEEKYKRKPRKTNIKVIEQAPVTAKETIINSDPVNLTIEPSVVTKETIVNSEPVEPEVINEPLPSETSDKPQSHSETIVNNTVMPITETKEFTDNSEDPRLKMKADLLLSGYISQEDLFSFLDKLDKKVNERIANIEDMYREKFEQINLANMLLINRFIDRYNSEMSDIKELYEQFLVLVKK